MTVGQKIGFGYALALATLLAIGLTAYWNITRMIDAARWKTHTYEVLRTLEAVLSNLKDAETGQRGYVITGEERYLQPYTAALANARQIAEDLRRLTADNADQQRRLDTLDSLTAAKLAELKETIDLRREQGYAAAATVIVTDKGKEAMDGIRSVLAAIGEEETDLLKKRDEDLNRRTQATLATITIGIPLAFAALSAVGFWVTRTITRQLRESVALLGSSSAQLFATTAQAASSTAETATAVSETTSTLEEVKQTAQQAAQKARHVADTAQKAVQITASGRQAVEQCVQGMQRIRERMEFVAESIVRLAEQSQAIGEITATVNDLAEQSNMLAVNAAIEAAKAGEQGKGFAVVAQEVKALADQSRQATAQVRTLLGDIQKATSAAVLATEQGSKAVETGLNQTAAADEAIRQLSDGTAEAAQAATQIAASSQQQMVGMDQVALAMENIKQASLQNAAGARQSEAAAQGLRELGLALGTLIGGKSA